MIGINVIIGMVLVIIGFAFQILGSLGLIRLPDVYNRLQAATKSITMGAISISVGVGLMDPSLLLKSILVAVFLLITNPISSHSIARAAYHIKVPLWKGSVVDSYGPDIRKLEKKEGSQ
ncbi:MAG: monovalent cation/H(+) antiporter subunit G [Candidatus Thermoplasmatota archaeon]|nr:monovalent cation/H(+) antiporter subunit G [Candidatus Thermoplasmatota archaeon]